MSQEKITPVGKLQMVQQLSVAVRYDTMHASKEIRKEYCSIMQNTLILTGWGWKEYSVAAAAALRALKGMADVRGVICSRQSA